MKKAIFYLGPPLCGKSTKSIVLNIPRFSVRHWFESRRSRISLPKVGTFLRDEVVFEAVEEFLECNKTEDRIVFDGFPGNAEQLKWIRSRLEQDYSLEIRYCGIRKAQAHERMKKRRVCYQCDGGADPVIPVNGRCPVCGEEVSTRKDDTEDGFERRWAEYFQREYAMASCDRDLRDAILDIGIPDRKADLHMHSTYSDGIYTPQELMAMSAHEGIKVCALTDHDSVGGVEAAENAAHRYGMGFVRGIELSAIFQQDLVHILGYGIRIDSRELVNVIQYNRQARNEYDLQVLERLLRRNRIGSDVVARYRDYRYNHKRGGWKLLYYLTDCGICGDGFEYFDLLKELEAGEVPYADADMVIAAIKSSGLCILAHPGTYHWGEKLPEKIAAAYGAGIDGIECYHPLNSADVQLYCKEFCIKNDLICTGGSDYHGNLSDRILGKPDFCYHEIMETELSDKVNYPL